MNNARHIMVIVVAIALVAVAIISFLLPVPRGRVFAGEAAHDFGLVEIGDYGSTVTHTFYLTNDTRSTMTIQGMTSSCGCVVGSPSSLTVEPNGRLDITASMTLSASGRKFELIHIDFGEHGVTTLQLAATGRRTRELRADRKLVNLVPDQPIEVHLVYLDYESDRPPASIRVNTTDDLHCTIKEWTRIQPRNIEAQTPARWGTALVINCDTPLNGTHDITCSIDLFKTTIQVRMPSQ